CRIAKFPSLNLFENFSGRAGAQRVPSSGGGTTFEETWPSRVSVPAFAALRPNDLRRTLASWLKQRGVDSMTVARLLGHTTSRMVEMVYEHLNDNSLIDAVSTLPVVPETGNRHRRFDETNETDETTRFQEFPATSNAQGRNRTTDTRIFSPEST